MNKYFITTITLLTLALTLFVPSTAFAKKAKAPAGPSAQTQQDFTAKWYEAMDGGNQAYSEFSDHVTNHGTLEEVQMMNNLINGKAADGGEPKGYRGDPNDSGPMDWSDYNIETDANGNVTGFKEKDFEAKDADGDGEISDAERGAWDEKKKKEHEEAGGPPGDNYHPPDWDKNEDGIPDPDFTLDCWKCKKPKKQECMDGANGPCMEDSCKEDQQCLEHPETHDGVTLTCHSCGPTESIVQECEGLGFMSDPACGGQCPAMACIGVDVDKETSRVVLPNQTRARGSTVRCYQCMKIEQITVEYIVIIIETPQFRIVLDKKGAASPSFTPTSVMVLADKEKLNQKLSSLSSLTQGGFDPSSLMQNALGMDKVSNLLQDTLAKGGKFTEDCFGAFKSFMPSFPSLMPPSFGGQASKMASALSPGSAMPSMPQIPGADVLGELTSLGPVVACGMSGADKVLSILDADGRPVDSLDREGAKKNPNALRDALQKAQNLSNKLINARQQLVPSLMKTAMKAMAGDDEDYPDDPYYQGGAAAGQKKKHKKVKVSFGADQFSADAAMRDLEERREKQGDAPIDQWGLHKVGYLPKSNPQSAWNVIDGQTKNMIVAVIDSGMDMTHPDGPQYIWTNEREIPGNGQDDDGNGYIDDVNGWNFLDDNNRLTDGRGHGTFVAGIIAAKTNNGLGIAGINPGAVIMPIKVADDKGETTSLNIFRAVHYAVSNGARVINISLGGRVPSELENLAFNYARSRDVFVAVASGNVNEDIMRHGPASVSAAFSVGAIDRIGTRSTVSNWGANNGLLAPGEQIYSLLSKDISESILPSIKKLGVYQMSGTSFSTPMVAATASLMRALHPEWTAAQVEDVLQVTADDMDIAGWDGENGAGLLNASKALRHEWTGKELTAKITKIRLNPDSRKKLDSVDVFVTVHGDVKDYVIELGKNRRPGKFQPVSVVYTQPVTNGLAARIHGNDFNGSDEWTVRVHATNSSGQTVAAQVWVYTQEKK